ncbi:MAG: hypothetical protein ABI186_01170 [Candidatus Elarobacter sp.]
MFEQELALGGASAMGAAVDVDARDRPISAAALRAAPPPTRNVDKSITCVAIFGVIGIAWHILWVVSAIFFTVAIKDAWWNTTAWARRYAAWEESYLCERCGFIGPAVPTLQAECSSEGAL